MWNLYKCKCRLIIEVILQNARRNNKIYAYIYLFRTKTHMVSSSGSVVTAIGWVACSRQTVAVRSIQTLSQSKPISFPAMLQ